MNSVFKLLIMEIRPFSTCSSSSLFSITKYYPLICYLANDCLLRVQQITKALLAYIVGLEIHCCGSV